MSVDVDVVRPNADPGATRDLHPYRPAHGEPTDEE